MEPIYLDSIICWLTTISALGGLALLVRHQQRDWLLLFLPLLWYLVEDLFEDRTSDILMFFNNFSWVRVFNAGLVVWYYYQWCDSKYRTLMTRLI